MVYISLEYDQYAPPCEVNRDITLNPKGTRFHFSYVQYFNLLKFYLAVKRPLLWMLHPRSHQNQITPNLTSRREDCGDGYQPMRLPLGGLA